MNARTILLSLAAISLIVAPSVRADVEPYAGGAGLFTTSPLFCGTNTGNVNGVCFPISGAPAFVTIDIHDLTDLPIGASYSFWILDPSPSVFGIYLGGGEFCGSTASFVPAGANALIVYLENFSPLLNAGLVCPAATTGAVEANFF